MKTIFAPGGPQGAGFPEIRGLGPGLGLGLGPGGPEYGAWAWGPCTEELLEVSPDQSEEEPSLEVQGEQYQRRQAVCRPTEGAEPVTATS